MILARTFGRVDVDDFLGELEPQQFDEWNAAYLLDPWGPERSDAAIARLAMMVERLVTDKPSTNWSQFVPRPGPFDATPGEDGEEEVGPIQSPAEQAEILKAQFGGF